MFPFFLLWEDEKKWGYQIVSLLKNVIKYKKVSISPQASENPSFDVIKGGCTI
jgi:hypothetical protein